MVEGSDKIDNLMEQISNKKPELVEFRFDKISDLSILDTIAQAKKEFKTIATDKAQRDTTSRKKFLQTAAELGFNFVDLDVDDPHSSEFIPTLRGSKTQLIISYHDLSGTPDQNVLSEVLNREKSCGGNVYKIVTTAKYPRDNLTVLSFVENNAATARLVSFAMGPLGIPSRVLSPLFGAEFTFASLREQSRTAEGQLTIDNLRNVWKILGVQ